MHFGKITDIKRISQVFQKLKSYDLLEIFKISAECKIKIDNIKAGLNDPAFKKENCDELTSQEKSTVS